MLTEKQIAQTLSSMLPSGRVNQCFESDAEIFSVKDAKLVFTTDEFSSEDLFDENEPYCLGWNIAVGAISDILASGGTPLYYAHALTVNQRWTAEYLESFGFGIHDVLLASGARFIGGDCGRSEIWRCTASVIGAVESRPITRLGAAPGDSLYITGLVGAGNLQAAAQIQSRIAPSLKTKFALRLKESAVMRKYASACIDTSDGVFAGLNTLSDLNGCGYEIKDPPYIDDGLSFCGSISLPPLLLLLGECGEYELLFTVKREEEAKMLNEARENGISLYHLGTMTERGRTLCENGRVLDLTGLRVCARDYEDIREYVQVLLQGLKEISVNSARSKGGD